MMPQENGKFNLFLIRKSTCCLTLKTVTFLRWNRSWIKESDIDTMFGAGQFSGKQDIPIDQRDFNIGNKIK